MEINQDIALQMRLGMRHLASGVAIVATRDNSDNPFAMTVSSITSLTDTPPSLLVCLHEAAQTHAVLREVDLFTVSILADHQQSVSECCSAESEMADRFKVGNWCRQNNTQLPYLEDALAVFFCRVSQRTTYGTHMIVVGDIQSVMLSTEDLAPLVYCRGEYRGLC